MRTENSNIPPRERFAWLRRSAPACVLLAALAGPAADTTQAPPKRVAEQVDAAAATAARIDVVDQDSGGVTLTVVVPIGALIAGPAPAGLARVRLRGAFTETLPGGYDLPVLVAAIGIPEGARPEVSTTVIEERRVALADLGIAAPRTEGAPGRTRNEPEGDGAGPGSPGEIVELEEARFRGLRLARLLLRPVRLDRDGGALVVADLRVRVDFVGGGGAFGRVDGRMAGAGRAIEQRLLNRDTIRSGAVPPQSQAAAVEKTSALARPGVDMHVDREGLVRVTAAELQAAGWDIGPVDPRRLEVSYRGTAVPARVLGDADGSFDPGDAIEFYAVVTPSRYSNASVYRLEQRTQPGLRFAADDATPAGAPLVPEFRHTERYEDGNEIYSAGAPAEEGDPHFHWAWFESADGAPRVTTLVVRKILPGLGTGPDVRFRASLFGRTDPPEDPDHRLRLLVNGTVIGHTEWNGKTWHTLDMMFDRALLGGEREIFRLDWRYLAWPDIYYLDWVEVEYSRLTSAEGDRLTITSAGGPRRYRVTNIAGVSDALVLDVSDPFGAVRLENATESGSGPFALEFEVAGAAGARYHVAGDSGRVAAAALEPVAPQTLTRVDNGADLIVLVPPGWESTFGPLVEFRRAQGQRVLLASLDEVADGFGYGHADDVAIRDFIRFAYDNYAAPPVSHVLLVGEPNLDPTNNLDVSPHHHLMPTHFGVTDEQGETMTDTWFGAVAGDDLLPDVGVARFSVRTLEDAEALVAKTIDYETRPWNPTWGRTLLHVASNGTIFEDAFDELEPLVPADFTVTEEYRSAGATTGSIGDAIEAGALIVSFYGHGNVVLWGDSPGGSFWHVNNTNAVDNPERLPLVLAMNCLNGLIGEPETTDSLSEAFHNSPDGGAIGMWSPSALGFLGQYDDLQQVLYDTVFVDGVYGVGEATTASLVEAWLTRPVSIDTVKEMVLLADPATRLTKECRADDVTCDGFDDDCDGSVDEDFVPHATVCGVGACRTTGVTACGPSGAFTDSCKPGTPAAEDATCDGIDDDCDGMVDDDYPVGTTFCGQGGCATTGQLQCIAGAIEDNCLPLDPALDDATCDGIDDDCDMVVDEDFVPSQTSCGLGECVSAGVTSCVDGVRLDSCEPDPPGVESTDCNDIDEDCDGQVDEEYEPFFVSCGVGGCSRTVASTCAGGVVDATCEPGEPSPFDAACDDIDEDCDGLIDEDYVPLPTTCGTGACERSGMTFCQTGLVEDNCEPGGPAPADPTCNGVDEDCDGVEDEDFVEDATACGVGACAATGAIVCHAGETTDTCMPLEPGLETCDGTDDDCDGSTDEADAVDAPTWYVDADTDGYGDSQTAAPACTQPPDHAAEGGDCDDGNPDAWRTPGEVRALAFVDTQTLAWLPPVDPGGVVSTELLRSAVAGDFVNATTCIDAGFAGEVTDPSDPPPGAVAYYLARARNGCPAGVGTLGANSSRVPRSGRDCP